ncbi:hypothetical protein [Sphingomonas azotifigens]|uniref:hypothetical protein n=1 Tax=Sphingomonas azotifigens TaxID=330920 RepID=UPI00111BEBD9|nr:hypothetical protein [Sphingomonas azotifigens]
MRVYACALTLLFAALPREPLPLGEGQQTARQPGPRQPEATPLVRPNPAVTAQVPPATGESGLSGVIYRFVKIVRAYLGQDPTSEVSVRSKGAARLSIVGISPDTISYVPGSTEDFVIPWRSPVASQIELLRGETVLARAEAGPGLHQLRAPHALERIGPLEIRVAETRSDGSLLHSTFHVEVVDSSNVPETPAGYQTPGLDAFGHKIERATYWALNNNLCYLDQDTPECGAWRLAAYQEGLLLQLAGTPEQKAVAARFTAALEAVR